MMTSLNLWLRIMMTIYFFFLFSLSSFLIVRGINNLNSICFSTSFTSPATNGNLCCLIDFSWENLCFWFFIHGLVLALGLMLVTRFKFKLSTKMASSGKSPTRSDLGLNGRKDEDYSWVNISCLKKHAQKWAR